NIRRIALHFDARFTGERLRQNECNERGGDHHEQENGEDDRLANSNDAPIIEKVQFCFLRRLSFQGVHRSKKIGASKNPAPGLKICMLVICSNSNINTIAGEISGFDVRIENIQIVTDMSRPVWAEAVLS